MTEMNGKNALVTGGTKGIGLATARKLLEEGYAVIVTYASDEENAKMVQKEFDTEYQGKTHVIRQAMEQPGDVENFIALCEEKGLLSNGLDVIVLNAGCTDRTPWKEMSWEQWRQVMDVNLNAPAYLLRRLDKYINEFGAVVFISSDMSVFPHATSIPYTASKAAINGITLSLVKEYEDRQIRVNAVLPGFVETAWQKSKPQDQRKRICDKIALHRFAEPSEIADFVMSVIHSTYINGSLIQVDGGYCYK